MSGNYRVWFNWAGVESTIYEPPEDLTKINVADQWFPCLHWNPNGIDFVVTLPNEPDNLSVDTQVIHAGVNVDILIEQFLSAERTTTDVELMKERRVAACLALGNALDKLTSEPFRCKPSVVFIA